MPRLRIVLIALIILALTSLFWGWSTRAEQGAAAGWMALTPEMAARQQVVCSSGTALVPKSFRVTATRWIRNRSVVFYMAECRDGRASPPIAVTGNALVELMWTGWQMRGRSNMSSSPGPVAKSLSIRRSTGAVPYTIVLGTMDMSDVAVIEVVLENGEVVKEQPTGDTFVIYIPEKIEPREIRWLDDAGQVLDHEDFSQSGGPPTTGSVP